MTLLFSQTGVTTGKNEYNEGFNYLEFMEKCLKEIYLEGSVLLIWLIMTDKLKLTWQSSCKQQTWGWYIEVHGHAPGGSWWTCAAGLSPVTWSGAGTHREERLVGVIMGRKINKSCPCKCSKLTIGFDTSFSDKNRSL